MNQISIQYYKTNIGELILGSFQNDLCLCDWRYRKSRNAIDNRIQEGLKSEYIEDTSAVITSAIQQLEEYFQKERIGFDLPLLFIGSDFQKKVWNELLQIPYGKKISYMTLTKKIGDVNAIRAVASANGANAISIIVPCHRVIASDGKLTGYAGGLPAKKKLLTLETSSAEGEQLNLF